MKGYIFHESNVGKTIAYKIKIFFVNGHDNPIVQEQWLKYYPIETKANV